MQIIGQNLGLIYGSSKVFEKISFNTKSGIWIVKGANGSGKTSLCRIICGLLRPTKGEMSWFDDKPMQKQDVLGRIGFATPEMGLYDELTVEANIKFFERITNSKVDDVFEVSKKHRLKLYRELSSGWKQRLRIIIAFLGNPDLLVLDEPEQHLDFAGIEILTEMIQKRQGLTIISTNNPWMELPVLVDLGSK